MPSYLSQQFGLTVAHLSRKLRAEIPAQNWASLNPLNAAEFQWKENETPLSHLFYPVPAVAAYIAIVGALWVYMKNREKFELKLVIRYHNGLLCLWSLAMWLACMYQIFVVTLPTAGFDGVMCDPKGTLMARGSLIPYVSTWYYYSKYWELIDTVIIVLKKRPLTLLQTWHHVSILFLTWSWLDTKYSQHWIAIALNALVHVFMYYYFSIATMGVRPWWRKYLTAGQLVQFTTIFASIVWWLRRVATATDTPMTWESAACSGEPWSVVASQFVNITFLYLFGSFFVQQYIAKPKRPSAKKIE